MSFKSNAQALIIVDPSPSAEHGHGESMESAPLEVVDMNPGHEHDHNHNEFMSHDEPVSHDESLEVSAPEDIEINVDELPGAPAGTLDPEPLIEVSEPEVQEATDPESSKPKKNEKWDWESKGAQGFVAWVKERCADVPKHSGYDSAGLERACAYLERLDNEISKAMRLDLDGELDANKVEEVRAKIDEGISRLQSRLDKVKSTKKSKRKKKSELDIDGNLIKEAQKITGVQGTFVTVPLLISGIARVCINGTVSAGHDITHTYNDQVKKYNLNQREKSEVAWLLFDMGYPIRGDRGFYPDEEYDTTSSDNYDFGANYKG